MAVWPDGLPFLLAGPILRRVEPDLASVWVAVRGECTVGLSLWEGFVDAGTGGGVFSGEEPLATGARQTRRVGEQLHVAVVAIRLEQPETPLLRPDTIYSYNITFGRPGGDDDLRSLGLLVEDPPSRTSLGYAPGELPSFALPPPELTDLKLVHASCRLINDGNDRGPDALAWLDDEIRRHRAQPRDRPHQLYLTGDQIYADHVAVTLLPMLTRLGNHLLGDNVLPGDNVEPNVEHLPLANGGWPADERHFPTGWRHLVATSEAGLTSQDPESHLFSLAEYCAMYLAARSPDVWPSASALPPDVDPDDLLRIPGQPGGAGTPPDRQLLAVLLGVDESHVPHLTGGDPCAEDADHSDLPEAVREEIARTCEHLAKLRTYLEKERALIERYHAGLAAVRRGLANVPTFMIFDDHDVTDDWNVTRRWVDDVTGRPLGRTVLRNGLLAYALFQGEGNDPLRYRDLGSAEAELLGQASLLVPAAPAAAPDADAAVRIDELLGLTGDAGPQVRWNYQVPGARHHTIVLDTRTHRRYTGELSAPAVISPDEIDRQIPAGPLPAGIEVLVVVSAVPVLGLPLIETIGGSIGTALLNAAHEYGIVPQPGWQFPDREAWAHDPATLEALLHRLAPYRRVVFLSGDVHYAMSAALSYWRAGQDGPSRFVQLASSGAGNSWPAFVQSFVQSLAPAQRVLTWTTPVEQLAWRQARPVPVEVPSDELLAPAVRFRLDQSPVRVPTHDWPSGATVTRAPDWSWRLHVLTDQRPADQLPEAARPRPVDGDIEPTDGLEAYQVVAQRHADSLTTITNSPRLLWLHNIGIVTFPTTDGQLAVRHDLLSRHPHAQPPEVPDIYTSHRARLDGTDEDPPTLRGGGS